MGQPGRIDQVTEKAVRRFLTLIASRYELAGAIVYGSRARGTHRLDSDADVAVLLIKTSPARGFDCERSTDARCFDGKGRPSVFIGPG